MNTDKEFEKNSDEYCLEEKEILILTNDTPGGASRGQNETLWTASRYFLAYVDVGIGELKIGDGRIVWLMTEEEEKKRIYFKKFKNGCIYRLRVRELKDKTVIKGRLPSFYNRFMLVDILEEEVENETLQAVLEEYRKPIILNDTLLGELVLNKDFDLFEGNVSWIGKTIRISLDVNIDNKGTWTKALKAMKTLYSEQEERDRDFKTFASEKLVALANEWSQKKNEKCKEITQDDFIRRISLSSLSVSSSGMYTAYYNDDDLFWGHVITVYGSIKKGIKSATIEG